MKTLRKVFLIAIAAMFVATQAQAVLFFARPYDPNLARWITRDPIGERGGNNLYVYVQNNPVNKIDPLGLWDYNTEPEGPPGGSISPSVLLPAAAVGLAPIAAGTYGPSVLAWLGFGVGAAETPEGQAELNETDQMLANAVKSCPQIDPNKLHHIFDKPLHNLDNLVNTLGSQEKTFAAIQEATQTAVQQQNLQGIFNVTVQVGSQMVTVTGNAINGVANIGTAYIRAP